jgi:Homeodomain-like domain
MQPKPKPNQLMPASVPPALARWFTPEERNEAEAFLVEHADEIPKTLERWHNGPQVLPDWYQQRVHRELKRVTEERRRRLRPDKGPEELADEDQPKESEVPTLSDEDYAALIDPATISPSGVKAQGAVAARIEAAVTASRHKPRRDMSVDRFMATADEYVEPYFAVRQGMTLGDAARKFNVADIQRYLAAIEQWLARLEVELPRFNRAVFLARLERSVEKRRKDVIRAGPVSIPRELRVRIAIPDGCRNNAAAASHGLTLVTPGTTRPTGCRLRTPETDRALAVARTKPISRSELLNRQLDEGLIAIIEQTPHSPRRRELVMIVDMTLEGKTHSEIAKSLGISASTVGQRLREVRRAAVSPLCGLKVEDELATVSAP